MRYGAPGRPLCVPEPWVRGAQAPAGATLHFRYLAEGGVWFDDETAGVRDAGGRA